MTWPVTQGLVTQEKMDRMTLLHHRDRCSAHDGGKANRTIPAGSLTEEDKIQHEATIVSVIEVLQTVGFNWVMEDVR